MKPLFRCEGVTRSYRDQPVVQDISLSLGRRELVALLGVSGVGKTTLFHILAGVDTPDAGRVLMGEEEITGQAGRVSYMLQKDLLFPYKRVVDNISLPLVIRGESKRKARARAEELFPRFGLDGWGDKYPHQLSGGMRQRAALLRTYLQGGDIMLLDEPFSALDAITKMRMHRWYLEVLEELGRSCLLITHDIDEALTLSHRIYILSGRPGRVVREIRVEEPWPRPRTFLTSQAFLNYKRDILSWIDND